ncbi:MAG: hypothetical protein ACOYD0_04825 [Candidatus Nanopelagicales bacterium]
MSADGRDGYGHSLTLVIYSSLTVFAVVAASTWKGTVKESGELILLIVASALAVAVAHGWAGLIEHRAGHSQSRLSISVREVSGHILALLIPAALACAAILMSTLFDGSFEAAVRAALLLLTACFSIASGSLARRGGMSWPRSVGWAAGGMLVGVVLVLLKA